jgi:outer membrane lipoprotein-sorting protein
VRLGDSVEGNVGGILTMRARWLLITAMVAGCLLPFRVHSEGGDTDAAAVLDMIDDLYRSDQSHGTMRMEMQTPNWSRTLELEVWTHGEKLSLFRILAPKKEKGTSTLRRDNEIWNYLPKIRRVIKLPSSMMSASWMGSDFSNDDLVKESRMSRDYTFTFGEETERDGQAVIQIVCTPKPDAPVVWGKLVVVATADNEPIPVEIAYYDEDMTKTRMMSFGEVKDLGGRPLPTRVEMTPLGKPDQKTVMTYLDMDFDSPIPESTFTLQALKR